MQELKESMMNPSNETLHQFMKEQRDMIGQTNIKRSKNRLSKGEKKRAKRDRRKYGYA